MSETFFVADPHFDHAGIIRHCKDTRPYLRPGDLDGNGRWASEAVKLARTDEMNQTQVKVWNATVGGKDTVYIIGDFAWKNHRRWINELNGKKIMLVGSHDDMPQDALDLFKPDWVSELGRTQEDVVKTMVQFREVHWMLYRRVCGLWIHFSHWPMATWQGKPRGSLCLTGHCHNRMRETRPGECGMGLILDVGWDVFQRPLRFEEMDAEMRKKFDLGANRQESSDEIDRD